MPVTFNNLNDPQATQQEPALKPAADRARESGFANLLKSLSSQNKPAQASQTPKPAAGSKEERIYNAVMASSAKYNLPPALVLGFMKQESSFNTEARSWCGAQGLMQLMPGTAKQLGVTDAKNIEQNVEGGCKYIRQMLDHFDGDLKKAIAAYNAGPGAVEKYNGVPPFAETKAYVPAVLAHAEKFNNGAPIVVSGGSVASVAEAPRQTIDYRLVVDAVQGADAMTQAAVSLAITSNIQPLPMPESKRSVEDAPPPPPPQGVRV
jgi:soluble lytic murein transglycosylase-like protein